MAKATQTRTVKKTTKKTVKSVGNSKSSGTRICPTCGKKM